MILSNHIPKHRLGRFFVCDRVFDEVPDFASHLAEVVTILDAYKDPTYPRTWIWAESPDFDPSDAPKPYILDVVIDDRDGECYTSFHPENE